METITKCLNEWNATLEALGQGKQTILIRKYDTSVDKFLLYPTTNYTNKDDFFKSFKTEYHSFAQENALPRQDKGKSEVKYYAIVENILEKSPARIGTMNKFHIWTNEHVKSYLNSNKAYIWLLRVYKLKKPVLTSRNMGMVFANTDKPVALDSVPVLSDFEFNKIKNGLGV
ncbi:hypothetical protein JCM15415_21770 [Methanobacterium movens]